MTALHPCPMPVGLGGAATRLLLAAAAAAAGRDQLSPSSRIPHLFYYGVVVHRYIHTWRTRYRAQVQPALHVVSLGRLALSDFTDMVVFGARCWSMQHPYGSTLTTLSGAILCTDYLVCYDAWTALCIALAAVVNWMRYDASYGPSSCAVLCCASQSLQVGPKRHVLMLSRLVCPPGRSPVYLSESIV